jgi:hypothetical protein
MREANPLVQFMHLDILNKMRDIGRPTPGHFVVMPCLAKRAGRHYASASQFIRGSKPGKESVKLNAIGSIAFTILFALCGCAPSEPDKPREMTTVDWLDACSPFESFDAVEMLQFRISDHTVELSEAVGEEREAGALLAHSPKVTQFTWAADDGTRRVAIDMGSQTIDYKLVTPGNDNICILAEGAIAAADLESPLRDP